MSCSNCFPGNIPNDNRDASKSHFYQTITNVASDCACSTLCTSTTGCELSIFVSGTCYLTASDPNDGWQTGFVSSSIVLNDFHLSDAGQSVHDISHTTGVVSLSACRSLCLANAQCNYFGYNQALQTCYLKRFFGSALMCIGPVVLTGVSTSSIIPPSPSPSPVVSLLPVSPSPSPNPLLESPKPAISQGQVVQSPNSGSYYSPLASPSPEKDTGITVNSNGNGGTAKDSGISSTVIGIIIASGVLFLALGIGLGVILGRSRRRREGRDRDNSTLLSRDSQFDVNVGYKPTPSQTSKNSRPLSTNSSEQEIMMGSPGFGQRQSYQPYNGYNQYIAFANVQNQQPMTDQNQMLVPLSNPRNEYRESWNSGGNRTSSGVYPSGQN
ncbi:hypothetical protein HK098_007372 [Nowakowskiella sp. JEL0407]|nr:hypothetical protein HK098_007372 [Nowakowskiella sp. JEL0407]